MIWKVVAFLLLTSNVFATEYVNISVGKLGIDDNVSGDTLYELQYRHHPLTDWKLIPSIGISWANNGSKYLSTEVRHDFFIDDHWAIVPSFGVGLFQSKGDIELGNPIEFRSGLELSYQFKNDYRAAIAIFHLSNGGISSTNPGTETAIFSVSIPIK